MQPNYSTNPRQRPLQKSMFLPSNQQFVNRNNSLQYQYQDMMKRSSIGADTSKPYQYQFTPQPQTPIHQYNPNQVLNFSATTRYKEPPRLSSLQQQIPLSSQTPLTELQQKISHLTAMVEAHQEILKKHNLTNVKQKTLVQSQVQQIYAKIKENVLPTMISRQTKEIYEHIFNFKIEIKGLKDDVNEINDKIKNELMAMVSNSGSSVNTVSTNNSVERIQKVDQPFAQLSANLFKMQNKLLDVQKAFDKKNDDLKSLILKQLQKVKSQVPSSRPTIKPSTIQSTLPPIMLEYRQMFVIKTQPYNKTNVSSPRSQHQTQILISSNLYYIDKEGYLLDNQNRYIVDVKGAQIKLQQKHVGLLKEYNVLNC